MLRVPGKGSDPGAGRAGDTEEVHFTKQAQEVYTFHDLSSLSALTDEDTKAQRGLELA